MENTHTLGKNYSAKLLDAMTAKVDAIIKRKGEQIKRQDYRNKNKNNKNKNKKTKAKSTISRWSNNKRSTQSQRNKRKTARKQSNYVDDSHYPPLRIELDL